jgi:3-phenylpropionate/trans-cinnamate dioxygenase ferredoxin reductase subunit
MSDRRETTDVLLVGGGVAAVRCARTLRREAFDGRILLVGDERMPPYNRPPLSKELLRDDLPDDLVLAEPERWYERRSVELLTDRRVTGLDLGAQEATLDDDRRIRFDRCLLATGGEPRRLPVPGGEHALMLRTLADARRLRVAATAVGQGARVVVVGGGFIGIEVATSLASLGLRPIVLELGARLWSSSLGVELSAWATDALATSGVEVRLGAAVTRVEPDAAWVGDERIGAAFVVAGIGVRPRTELAEAAGLETDDGIVTDAAHRTSHQAVWAAGDAARRAGRRIEHWHAAREGGERAARSMLGLDIGPDPAPWVFSEVAGHTLDVMGAVEPWTDERWAELGVVAYAHGDRLIGLAIIDAAMPVERARDAVTSGSVAALAGSPFGP